MSLTYLAKQFFETDDFYISHSSECPIPGYFIVGVKNQITSLTDMDQDLYIKFMLLIKHTYTIIEKVIKPQKIYTCMFGELQPKLHVHVYPRSLHLTEQYLAAEHLSLQASIDGPKLFQWSKSYYHNNLSKEEQFFYLQQFENEFAKINNTCDVEYPR